MAIARRREDSKIPKEVPVVEELTERRESTFTALVPESKVTSLLKYTDGHPWTVNYYGQLLNTNSTVNHFDIKEGNLSQSYVKIVDLVLKVQNPLDYSYDEKQGESLLSGSALLPLKVIPNVGDLFLAKVDSGEDALFIVTNVMRLTHRKNTIYEINYNSLAYINDDPEFIEKLEKRINETYYYNNDIENKNVNLLITPKEKFHIDKLKHFLYDSKEYYFRTFTQRQSSSLAVPGSDYILFDQLLDSFVRKTVDVSKFVTGHVYSYSNYGTQYQRESILDCLIKRIMPLSKRVERRYGFFPSESFFKRGQLHSPYYLGVDYLLAPISPDERMLSKKPYYPFEDEVLLYDPKTGENYDDSISPVVEVLGSNGSDVKSILPRLFVDGYYIVSEQFYIYLKDQSNYIELSYIELLIYRYLKGENVPLEEVYLVTEDWENWSYLHQFYLLPIVWFLARQSVGDL